MPELDRRARAKARAQRMVLRKSRLRAPDLDHEQPLLRGPEAVSLVHRLTLESWALAGIECPTYARQDIPIRFVRRPSS